jgi:hypothetical protein
VVEQQLVVESPAPGQWGAPHVSPRRNLATSRGEVQLGVDALLRVAASLTRSQWRITNIDFRDLSRQPIDEDYAASLQELLKLAIMADDLKRADTVLSGLPVRISSISLIRGDTAKSISSVTIYRHGLIIGQQPEGVDAADSLIEQVDRALEQAWS